jgi:Ni,Fe-hydrogenase I small subunit
MGKCTSRRRLSEWRQSKNLGEKQEVVVWLDSTSCTGEHKSREEAEARDLENLDWWW